MHRCVIAEMPKAAIAPQNFSALCIRADAKDQDGSIAADARPDADVDPGPQTGPL
jgi:hypothetical protein